MKVKYVQEKNVMQVIEGTRLEKLQLKLILNLQKANAYFDPRVKKGVWDGYSNLLMMDRYYSVGLWKYVNDEMKEYGYDVEILNKEELVDNTIDYNEVAEFCINLNIHRYDSDSGEYIKTIPYDYQIEAVYDTLRYKYCQHELSTSSGKTLISYMLFMWRLQKAKDRKCLMIVPKLGLLTQAYEDFADYNRFYDEFRLEVQLIGDGRPKIRTDKNVIVGTFQTLRNMNVDFFKEFDTILVDEAHSANSFSVKKVISMCSESKIRTGVSGTLNVKKNKRGTLEYAMIRAYLGPLVTVIKPEFIISQGRATPVKIKVILMDYLDNQTKYDLYRVRKASTGGPSQLAIEHDIIVNNNKRLQWISNFIAKVSKNSLVLFKDIKNKYGIRMVERLKEITSGKEIYYIDGGTKSELREEFKRRMEEGNNKILVASFQTFATGISINNIHNIFFIESYASEILIKQAIGRGMRLHNDKEHVNIIDFVDDLSHGIDTVEWLLDEREDKWEKEANYMLRQANERFQIYKNENFDYRLFKVNYGH